MTYTKTITLLRKINIVPRWFIFLLDMACGFAAIFFALLLRNNLIISPLEWRGLMQIVLLVGFVNTLVFASLRTYRGIVRFTGLQDAFRVFLSVAFSTGVLFLIQLIYIDVKSVYYVSNVLLIIYSLFCFNWNGDVETGGLLNHTF